MEARELEVGDVVQIAPEHDKAFGGKFMFVTEPKSWGAQGFVDTFSGANNGVATLNGRAYYRCAFENMEYVGKASWILAEDSPDE